MHILSELWRRITTAQPVPDRATVAALALCALIGIVFAWRYTRMFVTIIHEAGHAIVATLTGRKLSGITLHSDTSGLTVSRGRRRGPGMVGTLLAGYPAPGLVGMGAAALLASGHAVALLWVLVAGFALMLLKIRNFYGLAVMVLVVGSLGLASWYLASAHLSLLGYLLTWFLLLAGPRPVLESTRQRTPGSDAAQLARITGVPAALWTLLFAAATLACLAGGIALLAPHVFGT